MEDCPASGDGYDEAISCWYPISIDIAADCTDKYFDYFDPTNRIDARFGSVEEVYDAAAAVPFGVTNQDCAVGLWDRVGLYCCPKRCGVCSISGWETRVGGATCDPAQMTRFCSDYDLNDTSKAPCII